MIASCHQKLVCYSIQCSDTQIDLVHKQEIHEKDVIVSGSLHNSGKYRLLNVSYKRPELHLWDLETMNK